MATVTRFEFTDDIDGKALDVDDLNIVTWSWLGVDYEFETSTANLDRIENGRLPMSTLLAKSRRIGGRKRAPSHKRPSRPTDGGPSEATTIRQWAIGSGYGISERGRIPAHIIDAFTAAH